MDQRREEIPAVPLCLPENPVAQAYAFCLTAAPAPLTYLSAGNSGAAHLSRCRGTSQPVVPSLSADPGFFPIIALIHYMVLE